MKKVILCGSLLSLICLKSTYAAQGAYYVGFNGTSNSIHIDRGLTLDPTKVANPNSVDTFLTASNKKGSVDLLVGSEMHKNGVYGAAEVWYSPNALHTQSPTARAEIGNRLGGRLKIGAQSKQLTLYGIAGFAYAKVSTAFNNTVFNTLPGIVLNTNFSTTRGFLLGGVGLNYAFDNGVNINAEYQHMRSSNVTNSISDSIMTHLGTIGTLKTKATGDCISIGLRYLIKPFVI
jgi:opacity protein-like surface antigen